MRRAWPIFATAAACLGLAAPAGAATLFGNLPPSQIVNTADPLCGMPGECDPGTNIEPDANPGNLGMRFYSDVPGSITGIRFYKGGPANSGPHTGDLWTTTGTKLAEVRFRHETDSGWQRARLATPVQIAANTDYIVSYEAPNGHYADNYELFERAAFNNPPLHGPQYTETAPNGLFDFVPTPNFPTLDYLWSAYFVDVTFQPAS